MIRYRERKRTSSGSAVVGHLAQRAIDLLFKLLSQLGSKIIRHATARVSEGILLGAYAPASTGRARWCVLAWWRPLLMLISSQGCGGPQKLWSQSTTPDNIQTAPVTFTFRNGVGDVILQS